MRKFLIVADGHTYTGIFASSVDAVIDAIEKHPGAKRVTANEIPNA